MRMRDLLGGARGELRYEPTEKRVRRLGRASSTARARCWSGSRGGSCRPTPSRRRTSARRCGPRRPRRRGARRAAPGHPVRRPHRGGRAGLDRRPRRRRVPARAELAATWSSTSAPSTPGTRRTSGSSAIRATRSTASTCARPRGRSGSRSTARSWPRRPAPGCCSRPTCRRASTSRARTCASAPTQRAAHLLPVQGRGLVLVVRRRRPRTTDLAWSYEHPLPDAVAIAGLVSFWNERVDVFLDGELQPRPGGPIAASLRDEFSV